MKLPTILFCLMMILTGKTLAQMPPLETGVSQSLAKWRGANYSDVRYKLDITLEKGAPLMRGTIEVSVKLTDEGKQNDLVLDWRTTQFANDKDKPFAEVEKVNGQIVKETVQNGVFDYQINKEHLVISKKYLKTGENVLQIKFASPIKTSGSAITRYVDKEDGAEYIYSLFVPSDASTAFPVFDQPDLKARFSLEILVAQGWKVVSNTNSGSPFDIDVYKSDNNGRSFYRFAETKPISTYVFAFAAGEFAEFTEYDRKTALDELEKDRKIAAEESKKVRGVDHVCMPPITGEDIYLKMGSRIYFRKSQAEKFKPHAEEVFRVNQKNKLSALKLDVILLPDIRNTQTDYEGLKFLRESSVFR